MNKTWQDLLEMMLLSRAVEHREGILLRQGRSWMQVPCAGHEGLMALTSQLHRDDYLFSYYRGYHQRIAKGMPVEQLARDFFTGAESSSGGRSMSVHCHSRELNIFPDAAPVASQCLPAVGVAWGQKQRNSTDITLCSIGDSSTRQGEFYESVCFAVQEKLPVIFLVEDNAYGISTPNDKFSPLNLKIFNKDIIQIVDGRDAENVWHKGRETIEHVRAKAGPVIFWCKVDRLQSHTLMEDQRRYRSEEELAQLVDPITVFKERLLAEKIISQSQLERIEKSITEKVQAIYEEAGKQKPADIPAHQFLFAPEKTVSTALSLAPEKPTTVLTAFNRMLSKSLEKFPNMLLIGQDIEDPKGGVFGITAGLSTEFPERVVNAPIAEATILGTAIGLCFQGFKPVCEIQFIDFISPGFNQINTHIGNLHWRSKGEWQCPLIMYAPYGAYLPAGGLWHSESNEAWWTHIPGLRVAIPSQPGDAAGLLASAMEEDIPTLFLLPKHLLRIEQSAGDYLPVKFGTANTIHQGNDVSLVTWGNCVEIAMAAVDQAQQAGLSIDLIDLRTLVPCDWDTIHSSLTKTGRLVIVHEDNQTSGFGATVVSEITANTEHFELLFAAPELVARSDVPIPYNPELEAAVLPGITDILKAIHKVVGLDRVES